MTDDDIDEDGVTSGEGRTRDQDGRPDRKSHGPYLRPGRPVVFDTIGNSGP